VSFVSSGWVPENLGLAHSVCILAGENSASEIRYAIGPVDRSAAGLADHHLGIGIAEIAADEVVGHDLRVAVAPTPAGNELEDRSKVTPQPLIP
jgi:hypothetical protein